MGHGHLTEAQRAKQRVGSEKDVTEKDGNLFVILFLFLLHGKDKMGVLGEIREVAFE